MGHKAGKLYLTKPSTGTRKKREIQAPWKSSSGPFTLEYLQHADITSAKAKSITEIQQ